MSSYWSQKVVTIHPWSPEACRKSFKNFGPTSYNTQLCVIYKRWQFQQFCWQISSTFNMYFQNAPTHEHLLWTSTRNLKGQHHQQVTCQGVKDDGFIILKIFNFPPWTHEVKWKLCSCFWRCYGQHCSAKYSVLHVACNICQKVMKV